MKLALLLSRKVSGGLLTMTQWVTKDSRQLELYVYSIDLERKGAGLQGGKKYVKSRKEKVVNYSIGALQNVRNIKCTLT